MILNIEAYLHYYFEQPSDLILQLEASKTGQQKILNANIAFSKIENFVRAPTEAGIGDRLLLRTEDHFSCRYTSRIEIERKPTDIASLPATPIHLLPGEAIRYLMPSRYCPSDEFQAFVSSDFGNLDGGARIAALSEWIHDHFAYVPGSSNAQTTALHTFVQRKGICRDFAHLLVTLARASAIPARFTSVFAPYVNPQDFHAVAEVFLDGAWHLVDPTKMARQEDIAIIGVGIDAAEVAFMTSYGFAEFREQSVSVSVEA